MSSIALGQLSQINDEIINYYQQTHALSANRFVWRRDKKIGAIQEKILTRIKTVTRLLRKQYNIESEERFFSPRECSRLLLDMKETLLQPRYPSGALLTYYRIKDLLQTNQIAFNQKYSGIRQEYEKLDRRFKSLCAGGQTIYPLDEAWKDFEVAYAEKIGSPEGSFQDQIIHKAVNLLLKKKIISGENIYYLDMIIFEKIPAITLLLERLNMQSATYCTGCSPCSFDFMNVRAVDVQISDLKTMNFTDNEITRRVLDLMAQDSLDAEPAVDYRGHHKILNLTKYLIAGATNLRTSEQKLLFYSHISQLAASV